MHSLQHAAHCGGVAVRGTAAGGVHLLRSSAASLASLSTALMHRHGHRKHASSSRSQGLKEPWNAVSKGAGSMLCMNGGGGDASQGVGDWLFQDLPDPFKGWPKDDMPGLYTALLGYLGDRLKYATCGAARRLGLSGLGYGALLIWLSKEVGKMAGHGLGAAVGRALDAAEHAAMAGFVAAFTEGRAAGMGDVAALEYAQLRDTWIFKRDDDLLPAPPLWPMPPIRHDLGSVAPPSSSRMQYHVHHAVPLPWRGASSLLGHRASAAGGWGAPGSMAGGDVCAEGVAGSAWTVVAAVGQGGGGARVARPRALARGRVQVRGAQHRGAMGMVARSARGVKDCMAEVQGRAQYVWGQVMVRAGHVVVAAGHAMQHCAPQQGVGR